MKKQWIIRIGILIVAIICSLVWFIVSISFSASLSSKEFPLLEKWTTKLQGDVEQITIVENRVIIARTVTEIFSLDMQSGNILWQQSIARHFSYQPVLAKNGILFLTDEIGVLALNQSDGKVLWQQALRNPSGAEIVDVTHDLVVVNDPPYLIVYEAANGTLRWDKEVCREQVQAYFFDTHIVVPCFGLTTFDALSGETVWEMKSEDGDDRIWKSVFANGVIYFSPDLKNITAYDVKNRKQLWKRPMAENYDSFQAYTVVGDYLLVIIDNQLCVLDRDDGGEIWCANDLIKPKLPTIFEQILYLLNGFQNGITAYDILDGSHIGRLDFPTYNFIAFENDKQLMASSDKFLIFAFRNNIYAYGK